MRWLAHVALAHVQVYRTQLAIYYRRNVCVQRHTCRTRDEQITNNICKWILTTRIRRLGDAVRVDGLRAAGLAVGRLCRHVECRHCRWGQTREGSVHWLSWTSTYYESWLVKLRLLSIALMTLVQIQASIETKSWRTVWGVGGWWN